MTRNNPEGTAGSAISSLKSRSVARLLLGAALIHFPVQANAAAAESSAQPASASDSGSGDILVVAQRREEKLQDVPLSITVQSGSQLLNAGVNDTRDLTFVTPGLKMDQLGGYTQPAVRGVTTQATQPGSEANVATYVDGVYMSSQQGLTFDLPDIERVEVLKGPQGTLYGQNATGGAIRIFTKSPSLDRPMAQISLGYGRFNDMVAKGFVSIPLTDSVAVSIAGFNEHRDGYKKDLIRGGKLGELSSHMLRGKLYAELSDNFRATLTGYYSYRSDNSSFAGIALNQNTVGRAIDPNGGPFPTDPYEVAANVAPKATARSYGVNLKADLDVGEGQISSVTAYSTVTPTLFVDADYSPTPGLVYYQKQPDWTFSQDLQYASDPSKRFNFIIGASLYLGNSRYDPLNVIFGDDVVFRSWGSSNTKAYSAFAEANFEFTDQLKVIFGGRYSHIYKDLRGTVGIIPRPSSRPKVASTSWNSFTPRFSLVFEPTPRTNIYATYSQGFKSGGYDTASFVDIPVNPEKNTGYELGVKTSEISWLDINASVFYYDYKNQQVSVTTDVGGVSLSVLNNAASSEIYGADLEATIKPTPEFNIRGGLSLLHARYKKYPNAIITIPTTVDGVEVGGNTPTETDVSGNHTIRSPEWTLTLTATYRKQFPTGSLLLTGTYYHTDSFFFEAGNRVSQPAYDLVNGRIAWTFGDSGLTAAVWGKNLTNKAYIQSAFILDNMDGASYAPPRTYGFELSYSF